MTEQNGGHASNKGIAEVLTAQQEDVIVGEDVVKTTEDSKDEDEVKLDNVSDSSEKDESTVKATQDVTDDETEVEKVEDQVTEEEGSDTEPDALTEQDGENNEEEAISGSNTLETETAKETELET